MEDQNVAIRLKGFIDSEGLTHSQFADKCGIPRPSLSQLLSGRNKKLSDVFVGQIHRAFPDLSVLWLMFGEGPMMTPSSTGQRNNGKSGNLEFPDGRLFDDDLNSSYNDTIENLNSNLSGLNTPVIDFKSSKNKAVDSAEKLMDLQSQIEKLRQNPRKVTQITVYYDDSTFETFVPKN